MVNTWLISGPPGCGKTSWILGKLKKHNSYCGYLRLSGFSENSLEQADSNEIDTVFLKDQIPQLIDLSKSSDHLFSDQDNSLIFIELSQFYLPNQSGLAGIDPRIIRQLENLKLLPDRYLHFGRDNELPVKDTLNFKKIESLSFNLSETVWDPPSLNTFWFELVNGAYGDIYRAKALMNIIDGRFMLFNWIVSQQGSQFLQLNNFAPPKGRPQRISQLIIQGINLDFVGIQSTVNLCLVNDAVLQFHQDSLRNQQLAATL